MKLVKRAIATLLALALIVGSSTLALAEGAGAYEDVPPDFWASGVISKWSGYGVLQGDGNGKFLPNAGMTLGELATVLSKTFGYVERVPIDVTPAWADEHVEKAVAAGVIAYRERIDAGVAVAREQAIKLIAEAYSIAPQSGETGFSDNNSIGAEFKPYVKAFEKLGYIVGKGNGVFDPKGKYTRAEAMQVINSTTADIIDGSARNRTFDKIAVVRTPGASISWSTAKSGIIIGQGAGDGEVLLDSASVAGDFVIRGGGKITVKGDYIIDNSLADKPFGTAIHLDGKFKSITVAAGTKLVLSGKAEKIVLLGKNEVSLEKADVGSVEANGENIKLAANSGSSVETLFVNASHVAASGDGTVRNAIVGSSAKEGVEILTIPTRITVDKNAGAVKTKSNGLVKPGETRTTYNLSYTPYPSYVSLPTPEASEQGNASLDVLTSFPSGSTGANAVDVSYVATPSSSASIVEVSYSINGGAAEYIYLAGGNGISAKGILGTGKVFLVPGENRIEFTAKDSAGKSAKFTVGNRPSYEFGTVPDYDPQLIKDSTEHENIKYVSNRIIATAKSGVTEERILEALAAIQGTVAGKVNILDMYFVQVPAGTESELNAYCDTLLAFGDIFETAMLDIIDTSIGVDWVTNDPWGSGSSNQWGLDAISVPSAWSDYSGYLRDIKVGVADCGFLVDHEDLQLVAENVYNRYLGNDDHGTHVMGTIGAISGNGKGLSGVIKSERNNLLAYDIFDVSRLEAGDRTSDAEQLVGLAWLVTHGAKVINYSIGRDSPNATATEYNNIYYAPSIMKLINAGYDFVIVSSAGNGWDHDSNDSTQNQPFDASQSNMFTAITVSEVFNRVLVVGATQKNGSLPYFSNIGSRVDVVAPGYEVYSAIAVSSSSYGSKNGTSMAAPHAAGVTAMAWAANPGLSGEEVKRAVVRSANSYGLLVKDNRSSVQSGNRRDYHQINAKAAVEDALNLTPTLTTGRLAGLVIALNEDGTDGAPLSTALVSLHSGINDPPIAAASADSQGQYAIENISTGRYYMQIVADGYIPETFFVQIEAGVTTHIHRLKAVPASSTDGNVKGSIINASTGRKILGEISLVFRRGIDFDPSSPGEAALSATASNGSYSVTLPPGNYTVTASGTGYIATNSYVYSSAVILEEQDIVLSPEFITGSSSVRFVLTWGERPKDLDSHLVGPTPDGGRFHVYYTNKKYSSGSQSYADLDVDDITSYGPETVTITNLVDGQYEYLVQDYTNRNSVESRFLPNSQAAVRIYSSSNELLQTYNVPATGGPASVWHVFTLVVENGRYEVIPVNAMSNTPTSPTSVGGGATSSNVSSRAAIFEAADALDDEKPILIEESGSTDEEENSGIAGSEEASEEETGPEETGIEETGAEETSAPEEAQDMASDPQEPETDLP